MQPPHIKTRYFSICIPYDNSDDLVLYAEFEQVQERGARGDYGEPLEPDQEYIELQAVCLKDENGEPRDYPHDDKTAIEIIENNAESWEEML